MLRGNLLAIALVLTLPQARLPLRVTGDAIATQTYYLSATGDDSANGTSPSTPWQHLSKIAAQGANAGTVFLLNRGDTFSGTATLAITGSTPTALAPTRLGAYGSGAKPQITSGLTQCVIANDLPYATIEDLTCFGATVSYSAPTTTWTNDTVGLLFVNVADAIKIPGVVVQRCEISGYRYGVIMQGAGTTNGYADFSLTNNTIHNITDFGIIVTYSTQSKTHNSNGEISGNEVYNIFGRGGNTGYPIGVFGATGTLIATNYAHDSGQASTGGGGGPVGIILATTDQVTIRGNAVDHQYTGAGVDGQCIEVDGDASNTLIEFNYATSCQGAGIHLQAIGGATDSTTIRFNVVQACPFAVAISGSTNNLIYNNSFTATSGSQVFLISTASYLLNNALIAPSGVVLGSAAAGSVFDGNLYDATSFSLTYNGTPYGSLAAFRTGSGQEGSGHGFATTAGLVDPGNGPTTAIVTANSVTAYDPSSGASAVVGAGLDLFAIYGINPGTVDFHGRSNHPGSGYVIGACVLP